jgi:hypothetical protein
MALISPGVQVTVTDESNYVPAEPGTIPLIVLATAQDKANASGTGTATYTTKANAGKVALIGSQRDLISQYGNPTFYSSSTGSQLAGYELNEYGLLAAYSVLGISNRVYAIRADVDLSQLEPSAVRPTGDVANGTVWLDTANTSWGILEWDASTQTFNSIVPTVITDSDNISAGYPVQSFGSYGDYAVDATSVYNTIYYKNRSNAWKKVGEDDWKSSRPTVAGSVSNPDIDAGGQQITINTITITTAATDDLTDLVGDINSANITGVTAAVVNDKLEIYADSSATSDGSTTDGGIYITGGDSIILDTLGITSSVTYGVYYSPAYQASAHTSVPTWKSVDADPRPTGSVWFKTTNFNFGADYVVKTYSTSASSWVRTPSPLYASDAAANYALDAVNGGLGIAKDSLYVQVMEDYTDKNPEFRLAKRAVKGPTVVTGQNVPSNFTNGNTFTLKASRPGNNTYSTEATITLTTGGGLTPLAFVTAVAAANIPYVSASLDSTGRIVLTHTKGGVIIGRNTSGTPLANAFGTTNYLRTETDSSTGNTIYVFSNWVPFDGVTNLYTASDSAPRTNPETGTNWYYSETEADIMIHNGTTWRGYQTLASDTRGFDLTATNASGPIFSSVAPVTQNNIAMSALEVGDLWINTSDLDNFPVIYRYEPTTNGNSWVLLDNTDQTTENGILFADARWGVGTEDVVSDTVPTIETLAASNYLDPDAPDPDLYPRGMLLFNLRRSGLNVKQFVSDYFNDIDYPAVDYPNKPTDTNAWVSLNPTKSNGSPYMGRKAVRQVVVEAMKAAVDASVELREEQRLFNVLAVPGYPELLQNLVALNNDRKNTGFILGDTPLRLSPDLTAIQNWANNVNSATETGDDGLTVRDEYLGIFYPHGFSNDLDGNSVVVPATHMMLRTLISSDNKSFPWFAPAGTRRGTVDNSSALGYVNAATGEFTTIGVREALRDTLYEASINPITFLTGTGIVNYGNKTSITDARAMDRINVARLVAYIRGQLDLLARPFLFEPNDKITRDELKNVVSSLMNELVVKRGLYDYAVVCDDTNNTPARIDRNELYVDVAIKPVKAVEFIYIPVRIKNTGASLTPNV